MGNASTAIGIGRMIPCTACGCSQNCHSARGFGHWHCYNCGRNCKLFFL